MVDPQRLSSTVFPVGHGPPADVVQIPQQLTGAPQLPGQDLPLVLLPGPQGGHLPRSRQAGMTIFVFAFFYSLA